MNDCTIIVLGATGDLAKRKLIPALYQLVRTQKIEKLLLIGAAREELEQEQFHALVTTALGECEHQSKHTFLTHVFYKRVDADVAYDWYALTRFVGQQEHDLGFSGRRLLYVATASTLFSTVTKQAAASGLIKQTSVDDLMWQKIVYEKPFGHDGQSASDINAVIEGYFKEHQIYRVDHYLTKELTQTLMYLRFANTVFESLWSVHAIEQVQIVLSETQGITGRGSFYDSYGALKDVVQNHALQLLALLAMEAPERMYGDHVCYARAHVLKQVQVTDGLLGQADVYRQESGVQKDSTIETFALLRCVIDNDRWRGVPFYIKAGKYLAHHQTAIHIIFRPSRYASMFGVTSEANWLTIEITPHESFALHITIKKPGHMHEVITVPFECCHNSLFLSQGIDAYQTLCDAIINGERLGVVSKPEIAQAWRIIDDIYLKQLPLHVYQQGSQGPVQAEVFAQQFQLRWRS